jgi:hypothetical protein
MPIQPIDLQTLFSQLASVGKDHAVQKDAGIVAQSLQGSEIVKQQEHQDNSVNETKDVADEAAKISDEQKRKQEKREEERKKREGKDPDRSFFTDPDLGSHIDISG